MKISPGCVEILLSLVWWFATQQTTNTLHSSSLFKEKNIRIPQKNILKLYVFWQMWLCPKFFGNIFVEFSPTYYFKCENIDARVCVSEKREEEKNVCGLRKTKLCMEKEITVTAVILGQFFCCASSSPECVCLGEHEICIEKKNQIFSRFNDPFFGWIWRPVISISGIRSVTILKYSNYLLICIFFPDHTFRM